MRWLTGLAFSSCGVESRVISSAVDGNACKQSSVEIGLHWTGVALSTCFIEQLS